MHFYGVASIRRVCCRLGHQVGHQIVVVGIILTLFLAGCGTSDPLAYSKQQVELEQQRQAAQREAERAEALEPVSRFASFAWYIVLAVVPLVVLGIGVDA